MIETLRSPTRRILFQLIPKAILTAATACGINTESQQFIDLGRKTPTPLYPATFTPLIEHRSSPDIFDSIFLEAVSKAEELSQQLPEEFGHLKNIRTIMNNLTKAQQIEFNPTLNNPAVTNPKTTRTTLPDNRVEETIFKTTINPLMFKSLLPEVQVMLLSHELSHLYRGSQILSVFKGQVFTAEVKAQMKKRLEETQFEEESKEIFNNCRQIFALKRRNPFFKTNNLFETPIPILSFGTISPYELYLKLKDLPNPLTDPRWKEIIKALYPLIHQAPE